ncbi:MAG TPA: hypothetical protein EYG94_02605 [Campylobacterales bacterium]|nr:hypothetical protein [Campylobacterales bacterium]
MNEIVFRTDGDGFFVRLYQMLETVIDQGHGSVALVFLIGVMFGGIVQYSRVDKFEKIAGFAMLKDTIVPKMLFLAVGISSIAIYFMVDMGIASHHIKPLYLPGLIIGGILFGASMAILGKCPGTGPVSIAEGRIDVLVAAIGGIFGGLAFTLFYDDIFKPLQGESFGKTIFTDFFMLGDQKTAALVFGVVIILVAILIPKRELEDELEDQDALR